MNTGNMLRCLFEGKPKQWDLVLPRPKFASMVWSTFLLESPFALVYTKVPNFVADLTSLPQFKSKLAAKIAEDIKAMMELAKKYLEIASKKYKHQVDRKKRVRDFHVGDVVMAHLSKGRTPCFTYSILQDHKVGTDVYILELPDDIMSSTVNVVDLFVL